MGHNVTEESTQRRSGQIKNLSRLLLWSLENLCKTLSKKVLYWKRAILLLSPA